MIKRPGQDNRNILKEETSTCPDALRREHLTTLEIPQWWGKAYEEEKQTRTALNNKRRRERIPDLSFDLDGDGLVGNRDFVIAKLFDADKDGKLNEQERKAALEALNSVSAREAGVPILCAGPRRQIRVGNRAERRSPRLPHFAEGT